MRTLLVLVCLLQASGLARSAEPTDPLPDAPSTEDPILEEVRRLADRPKLRYPPLPRFGIAFAFRGGVILGLGFELGFQVWRDKHFAISTSMLFYPPRGLQLVGPFRTVGGGNVFMDVAWQPTPFLSTGPVAGVGIRIFAQQWNHIATNYQPVVGWRLSISLWRARTWSANIVGSVMIDTIPARFVNDTAEIVPFAPVEGFVSLNWHFGHGRKR